MLMVKQVYLTLFLPWKKKKEAEEEKEEAEEKKMIIRCIAQLYTIKRLCDN